MVVVKNIINYYINKIGDLKIVAYKYTPEIEKERGTNKGLVCFFNDTYIKSFILTKNEVNNVLHHNQSIVQDLGFIISFSHSYLNIIDMASYLNAWWLDNTEHKSNSPHYRYTDNGGVTNTHASWWFELTKPINEEKARKEYLEYGQWGIQLAIITALKNPIENDFLVPSTPPEGNYIEFDYSML